MVALTPVASKLRSHPRSSCSSAPLATSPANPLFSASGLRALSPQTLESLLLIRQFEELLLDLFQAGKLSGTTHTCLGQEYIPVTVMSELQEEDFIFSNHRGHGHYLARFDDPAGLLAEIMGREGGICHGVGGSQHLKRGRYISTGIQGESLPVAVGAALQLKREQRGSLAVPFIGDGTWGQGAVYEALNMAALWRVPVVVIVENNHIAQTTHRTQNMAGNIEDRVRAFGVRFVRCTGHNVVELRQEIAPVLAQARTGSPAVIEFETERLGSHSKGDDTRDPHAVTALRERSWHAEFQAVFPREFAEADGRVRSRLEKVLAEIEGRPLAHWRQRP